MFREGVGGVTCSDCHLGNPFEYEKQKAHEGLLSLIIVGKDKLLPLNRSFYPQIGIYSNLLPIYLIKDPSIIKTILYHDRDKKTYEFRIDIANKTCGKCHRDIVEQYSKSVMGGVRFQSQYVNFTYPAPHDCGYWLKNFTLIKNQLLVDYTREQAELNRRVCNQCHASCLDCHYDPSKGRHYFSRNVDAKTCYYGGGRGICHSGAEEFRRGGYYFKGIFTNMEDIHASKNMSCLECHNFINHNVIRKATCRNCHTKIERKLSLGVHRNLTCEACHIRTLGGYQIVVWGPGYYWNMYTPLSKHKYYGIMEKPLLIKNLQGKWIPVKPVIHFTLNINESLNKTKLLFRVIKGRNFSNDAYIIFGTYKFNNISFISWLQMDKVSHGYNRARDCLDCHATTSQEILSSWIFSNLHAPNVKPFKGYVKIISNETGLYLTVISNTSLEEYPNRYDFAPWLLVNRFYSNESFTMPKISEFCDLRKDCTSCHADPHKTTNPKYMKLRNTFLIILITVITLTFLILFIRSMR